MTPEKILEIARRYTAPEEESSILIGEDGNPTGETLNLMMWNFCEEELLAFARAVIEADRASSNEPEAWYDKYGMITYDRFEGVTPLYTRPPLPRKPLSAAEIESVISAHRFAYGVDITAYSFARAVEKKIWEKAHGIGETE